MGRILEKEKKKRKQNDQVGRMVEEEKKRLEEEKRKKRIRLVCPHCGKKVEIEVSIFARAA
jgi:hypothetical protein